MNNKGLTVVELMISSLLSAAIVMVILQAYTSGEKFISESNAEVTINQEVLRTIRTVRNSFQSCDSSSGDINLVMTEDSFSCNFSGNFGKNNATSTNKLIQLSLEDCKATLDTSVTPGPWPGGADGPSPDGSRDCLKRTLSSNLDTVEVIYPYIANIEICSPLNISTAPPSWCTSPPFDTIGINDEFVAIKLTFDSKFPDTKGFTQKRAFERKKLRFYMENNDFEYTLITTIKDGRISKFRRVVSP